MLRHDVKVRIVVEGRGQGEDPIARALRRAGARFELVPVESLVLDGALADARSRPPADGEVWLNRVRRTPAALAAMRVGEALGATCVNAPEVIARCADGASCAAALIRANVPVPASTIAFSSSGALRAAAGLGYPVTFTPVNAGGERWAVTVPDERIATSLLRAGTPGRSIDHAIHVQAVDVDATTVRVVVADDRPVVAWHVPGPGPSNRGMTRRSGTVLDEERTRLSGAASRAVGSGLLVLDLVESANGRASVDRVRSIVDVDEAVRHAGAKVADACARYLLGDLGPV